MAQCSCPSTLVVHVIRCFHKFIIQQLLWVVWGITWCTNIYRRGSLKQQMWRESEKMMKQWNWGQNTQSAWNLVVNTGKTNIGLHCTETTSKASKNWITSWATTRMKLMKKHYWGDCWKCFHVNLAEFAMHEATHRYASFLQGENEKPSTENHFIFRLGNLKKCSEKLIK